MANFYRRFREAVERAPDSVAVEVQRAAEGGTLVPPERRTYRELRRSAEALARRMLEGGVAAGARSALLAQNGPLWLDAYLGTMAAGAIAVPLDTNFSAEQIAKLLKDSGSARIFADAKHREAARRAAEGLAVEVCALEDVGAGSDEAFSPAEVADDDVAVIVYTSGTTSDPKGVMLTHGGLAAELDAAVHVAPLGPSDSSLGVLPLFHILSQMANILLPLAVGARTVFLDTPSSPEIVRALRERGITLFVCVPQFFYLIHERIQSELSARGRLAQEAFRAALAVGAAGRSLGINVGKLLFRPVHRLLGAELRFLVTGGARMDPQVCRDFASMGFELLQAYGLSETTGAVFATPVGAVVPGSVGKPMHGAKFRLRDPKPSDEAGGRSVGEIEIGGPTVMKGYYNRPDATAEVLAGGWLRTGDLGYVDEGGNLFISGRRKEMIVLSSGKNIFPEEIEAHYLKSPYLKEMCVVGLRNAPGEPFSERLHGVIVPNFDVLRERKIVNTMEWIRFDVESLSAQLPPTKRILSYEVWQEDLPRTTTRKIKRFEVERRLRARSDAAEAASPPAPRELTAEDVAWAERPEVARALELVRRAAKNRPERVHPRDNIELDLGLDSVERVELLGALGRELGASIDDFSQIQAFTARELVDAVLARVGQGAAGAGASGPRVSAAGPTWESLLREEVSDPETLAITQPRPLTDLAWYAAFRLLRLVARVVYRLEVRGLERLPASGPFILCPNHQSFLDAPVLLAALPFSMFKRLFYVGTSDIFGEGIMRSVARSLRLIPIDPDVNLVRAMQAGAYGLSNGRVLVLFPEGERSIDGTPKRFKKGAAILSAHLRVPLCPAGLAGFSKAWPRGAGLRLRGRLRIELGEPLPPPSSVEGDATYTSMTAELRGRIVALWSGLCE